MGKNGNNILYLARTNFRNSNTLFGMNQEDRFFILYYRQDWNRQDDLAETMLMQDIAHGRGLCLLDPHGDLVTRIKNNYPKASPERCHLHGHYRSRAAL